MDECSCGTSSKPSAGDKGGVHDREALYLQTLKSTGFLCEDPSIIHWRQQWQAIFQSHLQTQTRTQKLKQESNDIVCQLVNESCKPYHFASVSAVGSNPKDFICKGLGLCSSVTI